jgi:hypothetical protein
LVCYLPGKQQQTNGTRAGALYHGHDNGTWVDLLTSTRVLLRFAKSFF